MAKLFTGAWSTKDLCRVYKLWHVYTVIWAALLRLSWRQQWRAPCHYILWASPLKANLVIVPDLYGSVKMPKLINPAPTLSYLGNNNWLFCNSKLSCYGWVFDANLIQAYLGTFVNQ